MSCPFYGYAQIGRHGDKILFPSFGNQCALDTRAHSPCKMEISGLKPEYTDCSRWTPNAPELHLQKAAEHADEKRNMRISGTPATISGTREAAVTRRNRDELKP